MQGWGCGVGRRGLEESEVPLQDSLVMARWFPGKECLWCGQPRPIHFFITRYPTVSYQNTLIVSEIMNVCLVIDKLSLRVT